MYIVDSHCDSIQQVDIRRHGIVNPYNYSQKYQQLQFVAAFCSWPGDDAEKCFRRAVRYIGHFKLRMEIEKDKIEQVYTYADIERAFAAGKHAALLTIEGGTGIVGSAQVFRDFYAAGVRVFGMTWLCNDLCASTRRDNGEDDYGLTDLGREIIEVGNELGMIFDVSHLSDKAFWDVIELAKKPVIATHSNFRDLCPHSRNLTYDMAKALIDKGGVIGLNLYKAIINEDKEKRDIPDFFKHLDHCLEKFGEDNIAFGCDIDGVSGDYLPSLDINRSIHDQFIEFMQKHYSETLVEKVAGGNYLAYLKKYL